jgi:hypothetical protein
MTVIGGISWAGVPGKMQDFTWRSFALFGDIALVVASYLMLLGVLLAIDRLIYINRLPL